MKSGKVRVLIVGCGAIGQRRHLPELTAHPRCEVVACADVNFKRAKEQAGKFKVPHAFKDFRDALELGLDAAVIGTPNYLHARQSIACLKAGLHVLVEKPMAVSVPEARAMIAAAKKARRQLMVGHSQRMAPSHVRAKEIYQSGRLGRCLAFSTSFAHGGPEGWSVDGVNGFFFKKNQAVIGSLGDLGVHKIDLVRWLLADEVVRATAMIGNLNKPLCQVDDTAMAVFQMAGGALGQMFSGWSYCCSENNATRIYCEKGVIRILENPQFSVVVENANGERMYIDAGKIQTNAPGGQYASGVGDEFIQAICAGRKNAIPGEEGARSLAAVLACVESARKGRAVRTAKI
jgi:predicted dehydrogenase